MNVYMHANKYNPVPIYIIINIIMSCCLYVFTWLFPSIHPYYLSLPACLPNYTPCL